MKIKAVIFDMDGLMLDTEKLLVRFWCEAAREYGFPMEREHALALRSFAGSLPRRGLKNGSAITAIIKRYAPAA